jgi:hypothetical protein
MKEALKQCHEGALKCTFEGICDYLRKEREGGGRVDKTHECLLSRIQDWLKEVEAKKREA